MIDLSILKEPFMIRAIIAGSIISSMTAVVGVYAVARNAAFFANAIAHAALLGIALGLLTNTHPLLMAFFVSAIISIGLPWLEIQTRLNVDTLLGLTMPISMAAAVLMLSLIPGYKPELVSFLFGNILAISWQSIYIAAVLNATVLVLVFMLYKKLTAVAIDSSFAKVAGVNTILIVVYHNILLTTAIIPSVSMVGIVLVSALVVIPAAIANQAAKSFKQLIIHSVIISQIITIISIVASGIFNIPTGPTIVVGLGVAFGLVSIINKRIL